MAKQTNLIAYGSYTAKDIQKDRADISRAKGTGEFHKLTPGKHVLRILPAQAGLKPFVIVAEHYVTVPGRDKKLVFTCPRVQTKGKQSCPACDEHAELRRSANLDDRARAEDLEPSVTIYCNVIDRREEDGDPKILRLPQSLHDELMQYLEDEEEPIDFLHPLEGYDIIIVRKGTGRESTKYNMRLAARPSPIAEEIEDINMLISSQHDLEKKKEIKGSKELARLMSGEKPGGSRQLSSGRRGKPRHQRSDDDESKPPVVDGELEEEDDDFPDTY